MGRRLRPQGSPDAWRRVIGVVANAKVGSVYEDPTPMFYVAAEQLGLFPAFTVVVRTADDPKPLLPALRAALREAGPELPLERLSTIESHLDEALAGSRTAATFMGGFSLVALLLASMGVYAMVSFSVAGRSGEMGIRVAMGAPRLRLIAMVVGESLVGGGGAPGRARGGACGRGLLARRWRPRPGHADRSRAPAHRRRGGRVMAARVARISRQSGGCAEGAVSRRAVEVFLASPAPAAVSGGAAACCKGPTEGPSVT